MEISRSPFYVFDFDKHASLTSFVWTEKSAAMTVADYKDAIRKYARLVLKHRVRRGLVDLRKFRYRVEERFAFVLPEGEQALSDERPATVEEGEKFFTKQFAAKQAAIALLTSDS